jgi:hypothetical protein
VPYVLAQVLGAILAAAVLYVIASGHQGFELSAGFASNGYGEHSPGGYSVLACLVCEVVMTFMFLIVILGATDERAPRGFAPIPIGLALTLIHLISIPVTNTSVNPARSTGPALFAPMFGRDSLYRLVKPSVVDQRAVGPAPNGDSAIPRRLPQGVPDYLIPVLSNFCFVHEIGMRPFNGRIVGRWHPDRLCRRPRSVPYWHHRLFQLRRRRRRLWLLEGILQRMLGRWIGRSVESHGGIKDILRSRVIAPHMGTTPIIQGTRTFACCGSEQPWTYPNYDIKQQQCQSAPEESPSDHVGDMLSYN